MQERGACIYLSLTSTSFLQTPEPPHSTWEVFRPFERTIVHDDGDGADGSVDGMGERVESNTIRVPHARFDGIHACGHRFHTQVQGIELARHVMIQGNQIRAKLASSSLQLADVNARGTSIGPHLLRIRLKLIHTFLQAIDIAAQENRLGARLADTRLQLEDARLDLFDIRAEGDDIQIDPLRDGTVVLELEADMLVFPVAAVDVAILGQDR